MQVPGPAAHHGGRHSPFRSPCSSPGWACRTCMYRYKPQHKTESRVVVGPSASRPMCACLLSTTVEISDYVCVASASFTPRPHLWGNGAHCKDCMGYLLDKNSRFYKKLHDLPHVDLPLLWRSSRLPVPLLPPSLPLLLPGSVQHTITIPNCRGALPKADLITSRCSLRVGCCEDGHSPLPALFDCLCDPVRPCPGWNPLHHCYPFPVDARSLSATSTSCCRYLLY